MPVARLNFRKHRLASVALALLFPVVMTNSLRSAWDRFDELLDGGRYVRTSFDLEYPSFKVDALEPGAERAGLRKGDIVLAVNGRAVHGWSDIFGPVRRARTGDHLLLQVKRMGGPNPVECVIAVPLEPFTYVGYMPGSAGYIATLCSRILTPLFCLALGFWVAAVRIGDRAAWALLVLMLSLANLITDGRTIYGHEDALQPFLSGLTFVFVRLGALALAYFALVFPETLNLDRKFPWIKWIVILPMLLRAGLVGIAGGLVLHHHAFADRLVPIVLAVSPPGEDVELGLIGLFFLILVYKTVTAATSDARRRFLLLDTGAAVGLLPLLISVIYYTQLRGWPALLSLTALLVFPLTMAYVIVVHRAMDVRVVLRQGLQYLLATRGIAVLRIIVSVAIIAAALSIGANTSLPWRVSLISLGVVLLAGLRGFAQRLRAWIDRRFFREAHSAELILNELNESVRTIVESCQLLETVGHKISHSLHVARLAILVRSDTEYQLQYAAGYEITPPRLLPGDGCVAARLQRERKPQPVYFDDPLSWIYAAEGANDSERATLRKLDAQLLLPLAFKERLEGIIALGPKLSEEPYAASEVRLLESVATQTGMALENSRLTEEVASEVARRESAAREIEIAKAVQSRLFPQHRPNVLGLDYFGRCRPALDVGGDYFDWMELPGGKLSIVIGDVCGKGFPAALLMASLQASFRAITLAGVSDLADLMGKLNLLMYDASPTNRFATSFCCVYDSRSGQLRYSSAGHNPALLVRANSKEPAWLRTPGMALGLRRKSIFEQAELILTAGDRLVLYTDGVTEARNPDGDEFGEQRLFETIRSAGDSSAGEMVDAVLEAVHRFAAGTPQHDDITLIIAVRH